MSTPRPDHQTILLTHAFLAALTPLIPVPFVDDVVQGYVERRMVRLLAEGHGLSLSEDAIARLAEGPKKNLFMGIAKGAILAPIKRILRKTFMVLAGKRIVDLASRTYHVGYLVDAAFALQLCQPAGSHSPEVVRGAIERVVQRVPMARSPVTRALRLGFEQSQKAAYEVFEMVRASLGMIRREPRDRDIDGILEDVERQPFVGRVVEQLTRALSDVPREHFVALEGQLLDQLDEAPETAIEVREEHKP
ncbi:MAG: hypothetical protein R3B72_47955 [Polyangiaceae bacterium]